MNKNEYILQEYKHISDAILDIDRRIVQVFTGSMTVGVALLSAVAGLAFGKQQDQITVPLAYAALAPDFVVIPAFYLIRFYRVDIMRLGSYRRIFVEERNEIEGWETRLEKFRTLDKRGEANDPIPWSYWAVIVASAALFVYGIIAAHVCLAHAYILAVPVAFLLYAHRKWKRVIPKELPDHLRLWTEVRSSELTQTD